MRCPAGCDAPLVMSERHAVEIDYCPDCRGVWLDRGELDKILERAGSEGRQPVGAPVATGSFPASGPAVTDGYGAPAPPRAPAPTGAPGHRRKRRSFIDDLFDF